MKNKLKVHSIFESISGEAGFFPQGTWCTFIRLQGCNFFPKPCNYCDTSQAQNKEEGRWMTLREISSRIFQRHILITGGEPLMQKGALNSLIAYLLTYTDCQIQIETNGSICPPNLTTQNSRVSWVVDYKLASSGMTDKMLSLSVFADILRSSIHNYLKFVVANKEDLSQAISICKKLMLRSEFPKNQNFIISPINAKGMMIPDIVQDIEQVYSMLLDYVIFSVQLHKLANLP